MTFRRFRRSQPVVSQALPFNDSVDFITDPLQSGGATFPSLPSQRAVPPAGVHRFNDLGRILDLDSDPYSEDRFTRFFAGYGASEPHVARRRSPVVRVGATPVYRGFVPSRPLKASRREFNKLRVAYPERTAYCVRRAIRKSVLFALGVGGRRRSAPGRGGSYRRTSLSSWSC